MLAAESDMNQPAGGVVAVLFSSAAFHSEVETSAREENASIESRF